MTPQQIAEGVHWVGAQDWDRKLFDELIPLPDGTSYNAYLVRGRDKVALIDTVDPPFIARFLHDLKGLGVDRLDYLIANHGEQDHAGGIPAVLERYPEARLVCSSKARQILADHLHVAADRIQTVADGETLALGGRTLEFVYAPWVHWPETMLTYLREDAILFPCDLFGAHLAATDPWVRNWQRVHDPAKRYYAEIMMPFRPHIQKHMARLESFPLQVIAPSHGPLYRHPEWILNAYREWVRDEPANKVVLPYVSMHGSVRIMAEHLTEALIGRGIEVELFNLADLDLGRLAMALVDAATIVMGSSTVLTAAHPKAVYAAYLANALRPKARTATIIGSYGWAGRMVEQLKELLAGLKVDFLEPVVVRGCPRAADLAALDRLADAIAQRHASLPAAGGVF